MRFLVLIICLAMVPLGLRPAAAGVPLAVGDDDLSTYSPAWHAILREAGLQVHYVTVQQEQRRQMFAAGELDMDCCTMPAWRKRPEEVAVQLFTEPFFYAVDHIVYRADNRQPPKSPADLRSLRVATVVGFDYQDAADFGTAVETVSLDAALDAVADGRADALIINIQEYMRRQRRVHRPLKVGIEVARIDLRARIHKSHADLLPRINAAIARLRADHRIEALVGDALRQQEAEAHD